MNLERSSSGWILLVLAVAGMVVSGVLISVHHQIAATAGNYTSFCNVNETVNCDVVLTSPHAYLLGVPVAIWGALAYVVLAALALVAMRASRFTFRLRFAQLTLGLAAWNAAFSVYMAGVALFLIGAVCILCTSLYVLNAAILVAAWIFYGAVRMERSRRSSSAALAHRTRLVVGGTAAVAILIIGTAAWEAVVRPEGASTLEEIAREDPDFYRWYTAQPVQDVSADGNSKGDATAPITIVEFSDFQCGHCALARRVLKEVLPRYAGQVRMVFRHFPLDSSCNTSMHTQVHSEACRAAVAAECAAEQGRFWEYHDVLFENQSQLDAESLMKYARRVHLDESVFSRCLQSERAQGRVRRDVDEGNRLGIDSTPTLFLNGRTIKGALDAERLRYAIAIERVKRRS